jgi:hypothetical protein
MSTFEEKMQAYAEQQAASNFEQRMQASGIAAKSPTQPVVPETAEEQRGNWLQRNLDVPFGLSGAAGGAVAGGMIAGPPGAIVGSILGGSVMSGAGATVSELQYGSQDPIEAYKAGVEAALWSAGIDLVTFGVGSKLKGAWYAAKMKEGKSIEEAALDAIDVMHVPGSAESLAATQKILNRKGATLLPSQILEGGLDGFRERIASVGFLSRERMSDNIRAVNEGLVDEFTSIVNRNASGMDADVSSIGTVFDTILEEGRLALSGQYGRGLNEIEMALKTAPYATIDNRYITQPIDAYLREMTGVTTDKILPQTKKFIRDSIKRLKKSKTGQMPVSELIDFDRMFTQQADAMFSAGERKNPVVRAQIAEAAHVVREAVANALRTVDPKAAEDYAELKSAFKAANDTLFPKITKPFVETAKKGSYRSLGGIAANATNVDTIKSMKKSLAKAISLTKQEGSEVAFDSFNEVDKLIKEGFLSNKISKILNTEKANVYDLKNVAISLQNPTQEKIYREVLGKDFPAFKQLMNAVVETSESATGETGVLVLRGLEAGGLRGTLQLLTSGLPIAGATAAAGAGAAASAATAGAFALYIPNVFSKIVTNPQYINRLITIKKTGKGKSGVSAEIALNILVSEVIDEMSEIERGEAIRHVEQMLLRQTSPAQAERIEQQQQPPI